MCFVINQSLTTSALRLTMCLKYSLTWCVVVCVCVCVCVCGGGGIRSTGEGGETLNPLANKESLEQVLKVEL